MKRSLRGRRVRAPGEREETGQAGYGRQAKPRQLCILTRATACRDAIMRRSYSIFCSLGLALLQTHRRTAIVTDQPDFEFPGAAHATVVALAVPTLFRVLRQAPGEVMTHATRQLSVPGSAWD